MARPATTPRQRRSADTRHTLARRALFSVPRLRGHPPFLRLSFRLAGVASCSLASGAVASPRRCCPAMPSSQPGAGGDANVVRLFTDGSVASTSVDADTDGYLNAGERNSETSFMPGTSPQRATDDRTRTFPALNLQVLFHAHSLQHPQAVGWAPVSAEFCRLRQVATLFGRPLHIPPLPRSRIHASRGAMAVGPHH